MDLEYLSQRIVETKTTRTPDYGMTRFGYTGKQGAPTRYMIRLEGERRWRRLMCWQFSNAGTCFVKMGGERLIVRDSDIPD